MNEDFVTYEQAVKLKECGFDWKCNFYYTNKDSHDECIRITGSADLSKNFDQERRWEIPQPICPAPTMAQAAKWLREAKGLFINIWLCASGFGWVIEKYGNPNYNGTFVTEHDGESGDDEDSGFFTTYESALSAGIDVALNKISNN